MRHCSGAASIRQHTHNSRRTLITRGYQVKLFHELRIGGKSSKGRWPGIQDLVEVGSEGNHHLRLAFARESKHRFSEGSPAKMRLGAGPQDGNFFHAPSGAMVKTRV